LSQNVGVARSGVNHEHAGGGIARDWVVRVRELGDAAWTSCKGVNGAQQREDYRNPHALTNVGTRSKHARDCTQAGNNRGEDCSAPAPAARPTPPSRTSGARGLAARGVQPQRPARPRTFALAIEGSLFGEWANSLRNGAGTDRPMRVWREGARFTRRSSQTGGGARQPHGGFGEGRASSAERKRVRVETVTSPVRRRAEASSARGRRSAECASLRGWRLSAASPGTCGGL
jgi:hypothetical protein